MAKKIYDILPPKVAHELEDTIKELTGDHKKKKRNSNKAKTHRKERRLPLKEIIVGGLIVFVLLGFYLAGKLPKANITIWPKMNDLTLQDSIVSDKSVNSVDLLKKVIPAEHVEVQKYESQEFPATGSASNEAKATGTITVYNKLDPVSPFTLIKGTHFLSDSGKYFVILEKAIIPPAKYQKGKLVPGYVSVKVEAKAVGEDHNIGASKFSIPKLSGTSYYYSIWAESESQMTGGYSGRVKKVTKEDILNAEDFMVKKASEQAEESLRSKLSLNDVLFDESVLKETISVSSSVKEGVIADNFKSDAKVKVLALVFKKDDLKEFAKNYILSKLSYDENLLESSLNIDYVPQLIDIKGGSEKLDLKLFVKTYKNIDKNYLTDFFNMKSASEIEDMINQIYGEDVSKIKVDFWPFWVKKSPRDINRIKINLNFE